MRPAAEGAAAAAQPSGPWMESDRPTRLGADPVRLARFAIDLIMPLIMLMISNFVNSKLQTENVAGKRR